MVEIKEETTPLVIDLAKSFLNLVREIEPQWKKAYLRFQYDKSGSQATGSYVCGTEAKLISALKHSVFFDTILIKGPKLLSFLGKAKGVFLLSVNSDFTYEIKFEDHDMEKWGISKLDGGSGIPQD